MASTQRLEIDYPFSSTHIRIAVPPERTVKYFITLRESSAVSPCMNIVRGPLVLVRNDDGILSGRDDGCSTRWKDVLNLFYFPLDRTYVFVCWFACLFACFTAVYVIHRTFIRSPRRRLRHGVTRKPNKLPFIFSARASEFRYATGMRKHAGSR